MATKLSDEEIDVLARKRAGAKMGWFIHATVFVLVNVLIFARSEYGFGNRSWSIWPLLGWGFGLAMHGMAVFVLGGSSPLRERLVQRERDKLLQQRNREP
jgi:hypothetical protein